jgi:hypothetical protein
MTPPAEHDLALPLPSGKTAPQPAQLQFNSAGAWRSGLSFDADNVPNEFWEASDHLARLSGEHVGMRVLKCVPNGSGGYIASRHVLMNWTRERGWVKT